VRIDPPPERAYAAAADLAWEMGLGRIDDDQTGKGRACISIAEERWGYPPSRLIEKELATRRADRTGWSGNRSILSSALSPLAKLARSRHRSRCGVAQSGSAHGS
jgi:hypothetical protein